VKQGMISAVCIGRMCGVCVISVFIHFLSIHVLFANTENAGPEINKSVIRIEGNFQIITERDINAVTRPRVYDNGMLFTFSADYEIGTQKKQTDTVYLSGSFVGWAKNIRLTKTQTGLYYCFLPLELSAGAYTYRYLVDGVWINDPLQTFSKDDGYGTRISAFVLDKNIRLLKESPKPLGDSMFLFFLKDAGYRTVNWVGSRNSWDPYIDKMTLEDGVWVIRLKITSEFIFYRYNVDGKTMLDPANLNVTRLPHGEEVNFVPIRKIGEPPPR